tara:strand:+ start:1663 stop:1812 length:150 start_codon:yes stop_codon:yes gene_type:complete
MATNRQSKGLPADLSTVFWRNLCGIQLDHTGAKSLDPEPDLARQSRSET